MTTGLRQLRATGISGSASAHSRSQLLLARTLAHLAAAGVAAESIDLTTLSADALLARRRDGAVDHAIARATQSPILVIATPVYQGSYAGQLKAFLDLFPKEALRERVVGLIATGGRRSHAQVIDYGLRPLVSSLGGLSAAQSLYVADSEFPDKAHIPAVIDDRLDALAHELTALARATLSAYAPLERALVAV